MNFEKKIKKDKPNIQEKPISISKTMNGINFFIKKANYNFSENGNKITTTTSSTLQVDKTQKPGLIFIFLENFKILYQKRYS